MEQKQNKWFGVKVIYIHEISGSADPKKIDENFREDYVAYEESVILIKADSIDNALSKAEKTAKENEFDYENIYGQRVNINLHHTMSCFNPFDDRLRNGSEVYSNIFESKKNIDTTDYLKQHFPLQSGKKHMLLNTEFNQGND